MRYRIDINCDLGEGVVDDALLMPLISSCNIACGGHAGNVQSMTRALKLAEEQGVKAGAHPSFPDKEHFGRRDMMISLEELQSTIIAQIQRLWRIAEKEKVVLHHVKPHGALYTKAVKEPEIAKVIVKAVRSIDKSLAIYAPYQSELRIAGERIGVKVIYEAFADRNYQNDLSLVSRQKERSIIESPKEVYEHLIRMVKEGSVKTIEGELQSIKAQTFCIHGDHTNTIDILQYLHSELPQNGIEISRH